MFIVNDSSKQNQIATTKSNYLQKSLVKYIKTKLIVHKYKNIIKHVQSKKKKKINIRKLIWKNRIFSHIFYKIEK